MTWDTSTNGGTADFMLGANKTEWSAGDLPPSPASGEIASAVQ